MEEGERVTGKLKAYYNRTYEEDIPTVFRVENDSNEVIHVGRYASICVDPDIIKNCTTLWEGVSEYLSVLPFFDIVKAETTLRSIDIDPSMPNATEWEETIGFLKQLHTTLSSKIAKIQSLAKSSRRLLFSTRSAIAHVLPVPTHEQIEASPITTATRCVICLGEFDSTVPYLYEDPHSHAFCYECINQMTSFALTEGKSLHRFLVCPYKCGSFFVLPPINEFLDKTGLPEVIGVFRLARVGPSLKRNREEDGDEYEPPLKKPCN